MKARRQPSYVGHFAIGLGRVFLLAALTLLTTTAVASPAVETFGPGTVECRHLIGTEIDCLLAASRITQGNKNVAAFTVETLPHDEQALFRKWCVTAADGCQVVVRGRRSWPESTRLSFVTSVRWTRPSAPVDQAAARDLQRTSATETTGPVPRPAGK